MSQEKYRECSVCSKETSCVDLTVYWIGKPENFKRGYRCPRCQAYYEGRGGAFDVAHDSKYAHITCCPIGGTIKLSRPELERENYLLSLELFNAQEIIKDLTQKGARV